MFCSVMATVTSAWILSIVTFGCTFSIKGSPVNPSPPDCHIPCNESCSADIICTWTSNPDPKDSLTYTLHWEGHKSNTTGHRGVIQRLYFTSHSQLQVWVEAQDQDGTVFKSANVAFNTADIIKPSPPKIESSCKDPIEIYWSSPCDQLMLEVGHCEVRHRKEPNMDWIQPEDGGMSGSYMLNNPEPNTNYLFQVRCACDMSMMSDWSEVTAIRSAERAPIGKLDIWSDCGMFPQSIDCVLTWKKLPKFEARGHILGYSLKLHYIKGTNVALNESAAVSVNLICSEVQCYHNTSLKDVQSVSIHAYNTVGMTAPSHLTLKTPVTVSDQKPIDLEMKENRLTVSWNVSWITDNIKEFVVQYKEAGSPLGEGFDWVRVNRSQTKITIRGWFKKYTAYQVSVYFVLNHNAQLYCTDVTHFVQGIPAKVPLFKVLAYGSTHVTLLWETVLMSVHNGVTPYYQVGYGKNNVYNVSAFPQRENRTLILKNLTEDYFYEVWIKAVNQAGPGPNTTVLFKTLPTEIIGIFIPWFLGCFGTILLVLFFLVFFVFSCRKKETCPSVLSSLYEKVPDPHNSIIIREMKYQISDSLAWLCIPATDQHPKISIIEIVNISPCALNSKVHHKTNSDCEDTKEDEHKKTLCGSEKQAYSKMVDSDEDKNEKETCSYSSSSEEDNAGYEQHFMPTDMDLKEMDELERAAKSWGEE